MPFAISRFPKLAKFTLRWVRHQSLLNLLAGAFREAKSENIFLRTLELRGVHDWIETDLGQQALGDVEVLQLARSDLAMPSFVLHEPQLHLPRLRQLELCYVRVLRPRFVDFLSSHTPNLRCIRFHNVLIGIPDATPRDSYVELTPELLGNLHRWPYTSLIFSTERCRFRPGGEAFSLLLSGPIREESEDLDTSSLTHSFGN
jgi:hypothetical protein